MVNQSEQTHTAARPSRISTAFPFDYPEAYDPGTCKLDYDVAKEQSVFTTQAALSQEKTPNKILPANNAETAD